MECGERLAIAIAEDPVSTNTLIGVQHGSTSAYHIGPKALFLTFTAPTFLLSLSALAALTSDNLPKCASIHTFWSR